MEAGRPSLLAQLRAATVSVHAELDRGLDLLAEGIPLERYIAFLQASLNALEPLEHSLGVAPALPAVPYRARAPRLRLDLAALGVSPNVDTRAAPPHVASEASACGARYVIEGSALGGAVLARKLRSTLQLDTAALGYLTLYGDGLAEHWRAFVGELEGWSKSATLEMHAEACDTARAVFATYRAAFERAGAFVSHR